MSPIRDCAGQVIGAVGIGSDVSELKRAELATQASERRYRGLLEDAPVAMCELDRQGELTYINRQWAELAGRSPNQLLAEGWQALLHPEDAERLRAAWQEASTRGGRTATRARFVQPASAGGAIRWVDLWLTPLNSADSVRGGWVGTAIDVTEAREADLQNQALAQSEKLRALGQMASGVAHDLNQSLALVAGYAELAVESLRTDVPDVGDVEDMLSVVARAAHDGGATVKRLLSFARTELEATYTALDAGTVLREVADLTAPRWRDAARAEGRVLSVDVSAPTGLLVYGAAAELREALTNLVLNAIDAIAGDGVIGLAARDVGEQVEISVSDSGSGMSDDVRARIFEPFFTTKGERGSGLGLSVVFGISHRHGGHLTVESTLGVGTTFTLSLPRAEQPVADTPSAGADPLDGAALRVLAVDDEPALANLIASALRRDGHDVDTAVSGEEALVALEHHRFDLVVSDLGMGDGMDGWQLADLVRTRWPETRFVLATGWGARISHDEAHAHGVETVIAKPYRMVDLRRLAACA